MTRSENTAQGLGTFGKRYFVGLRRKIKIEELERLMFKSYHITQGDG